MAERQEEETAETADNDAASEYEVSLAGILSSIAKRAKFDAESLLSGGEKGRSAADAVVEPPPLLRGEPERQASLQQLLDKGAVWKPVINDITGIKVHRLADIRYGTESPRQSLDLYFPDDATSASSSSEEATRTSTHRRPVYIHIHGGGWSRGAKDSPFYGGPAMCQQAVASKNRCIAVAVGYRLGTYPEFMHDAAAAIHWVYQNIASLGGDLNHVFLSGHSAGGHISSLLVLRQKDFLTPLGIPHDLFKGLILVSGVYDVFSPLKKNVMDAKNKWFALAYAMPAFGTDSELKKEASPLLLLKPDKETSVLGNAALSFTRAFKRLSWASSEQTQSEPRTGSSSSFLEMADDKDAVIILPRTLILNATYDMGLQENGQLMAQALSDYTNVKYRVIDGSDHASICWNAETAKVVEDFVYREVTGRQRRDKRDKSPMPEEN
jgi:acetyl esterase/lipase